MSSGKQYYLPIAIFLKKNHPKACPIILVTPTQNMGIQESKFVDKGGRVYLPYLAEWKPVIFGGR